LLHSAVKCPIDSSLNKNSPAPGREADFPTTVVSSCDEGQRFDDGLSDEKIKCSAAGPTGLWNHLQYSCDGNYSTWSNIVCTWICLIPSHTQEFGKKLVKSM